MSISNKKLSSKSEDKLPMLPPSSDDESSDELSPIEEERSSSSNSGASDSSHSKYVSSFLGSSTPSVSSESSETSSYKNLHEEYGTPTDHEFSDIETNSDSNSSNISGKSIKSQKSPQPLGHSKTANINYDEIEVDVQHQSEQYAKTHSDPSHGQETIVETVTVIQHIAEVHGEFSEETLVEVDEEVPFEAVLNGLSERFRDDENNSHHSNVSWIIK